MAPTDSESRLGPQVIRIRNPTEIVDDTVDGSEIRRAPVDMVNIPIIYRVLYIPGGCLGFFPSTVAASSWTTDAETTNDLKVNKRQNKLK